MEIILIVTIVVCFACNAPDVKEVCTHSYCNYKEYDSLRRDNEHLRYVSKLYEDEIKRYRLTPIHSCLCPHFTPCENFEKKYYAVDKERQDLVDIILKGQKSAEQVLKDLNLKA